MPLKPAPINEEISKNSQIWVRWFSSIVRLLGIVNNDKSISPVTLADVDAPNNSVYYSSTQSKLVYKDSGGTVNNLY